MICITNADLTVGALKARITRHPDAELLEVRLDLLEEPLPQPSALGVDPGRLLVACRPESEGGRFAGDEERRLAWMEGFVRGRVGWIDIELSTAKELREQIIAAARRAGTKILVSHHHHQAVSVFEARKLMARLSAAGGDAVKLAVAVSDAAELDPLWQVGQQAMLPVVLVGMGPAGLLSRAFYPRFGSFMTYVASRAGEETSKGQLSLDQFESFHLPPGPQTGLYVLLGGMQVLSSPGPRVYNTLFARHGIDACYLPVVTGRPAETLNLLRLLGLKGASVTMPLKQQVATIMDVLSKMAADAAVVNTITVDPEGRLLGDLTDGRGAVEALQKTSGSLFGKRSVILGAGATAAAIAQSLVAAGVLVTILGRDRRRADRLAARFRVSAGHLNDLPSVPFDILIQATPVGADDPEATLVEHRRLLTGRVVLDVVLGEETRLLRDTREAGGVAVPGRSLWAEQGCLQLKCWLNLNLPADALEAELC